MLHLHPISITPRKNTLKTVKKKKITVTQDKLNRIAPHLPILSSFPTNYCPSNWRLWLSSSVGVDVHIAQTYRSLPCPAACLRWCRPPSLPFVPSTKRTTRAGWPELASVLPGLAYHCDLCQTSSAMSWTPSLSFLAPEELAGWGNIPLLPWSPRLSSCGRGMWVDLI